MATSDHVPPPTTGQEPPVPTTTIHTSAWLIALVAVLFLAGAVVSYVGISRPTSEMPPSLQLTPTPNAPVRIDLPHEEFAAPAGPHRERFVVSCTICHSTRLVFTQPPFPEKKWQEVVHKMVATFGAPFTPADESEIVSYLTAVHGPPSP
jgi:hypothetical protein